MALVLDPGEGLGIDPDCRRCAGLVERRERIAWDDGPFDADSVGCRAASVRDATPRAEELANS
jgi:hypothetical protein